MFKFNQDTKPLDFPLITQEYKDILFDNEPILYCGKNKFGNWIIGSSIDEDHEKKIDWHFHAVVSFELINRFFKRELSYLEIMKDAGDLFVIEKAFDNSFMRAYPIAFEDIPVDYLPTEESWCPVYSSYLYPSLTHRFHLEGAEAAKHRVLTKVFSNIADEAGNLIKNGLSLLKKIGITEKTYIFALNPSSFEIILKTEIEYSGGEDGFLLDASGDLENRMSDLLDKYFGYCISKLPDSIDIIKKNKLPEDAGEIFEGYKKLIRDNHFQVSESYEKYFIDKMTDTQKILADLTEDIGHSYTSIELSGISPITKIGKKDYSKFERTVETIQKELYTEDIHLDEYKIHIYQLNTESRKGKAYIHEIFDDDKKMAKISIEIEGEEPLEGSKYTGSLHEDTKIEVTGKLKRKDGNPKYLTIKSD